MLKRCVVIVYSVLAIKAKLGERKCMSYVGVFYLDDQPLHECPPVQGLVQRPVHLTQRLLNAVHSQKMSVRYCTSIYIVWMY
jgi:hypothetical protein